MSAARLRAITGDVLPPETDADALRAALADAIGNFAEAERELAVLTAAEKRLKDERIAARRAAEQADADVEALVQSTSRRTAAAALAGDVSRAASDARAAQAQREQAWSRYQSVKESDEALAAALTGARSGLRSATERRDAVAEAVLATRTDAVRDDCARLGHQFMSRLAELRYLLSHGGEPWPPTQEARRMRSSVESPQEYYALSKPQVVEVTAKWAAALAALKTDADAPLPEA